jgi:hypothetical protein
MTLTLRNDYGCTEAVIAENCGFDRFLRIADILAEKLNIRFTSKLEDSEISSWDFLFKGHMLTLQYNIYDGVSIFPRNCRMAERKDNQAVMELAHVLTVLP